MSLVSRTARYRGTITLPLMLLPYAIPAGGTYDPQAFQLQTNSIYPAMNRVGFNGGTSLNTALTNRRLSQAGGKSYFLTPTALDNFTASPNAAPTGVYSNSPVCFGDDLRFLAMYDNNVTALIVQGREANFNLKAVNYFSTPGGGIVSSPLGSTVSYADRYDPYPRRPALFYVNNTVHAGQVFYVAKDAPGGPNYQTAVASSDVTETAMAQASQILNWGRFGNNYLLSSRSAVLKTTVTLQPWVTDQQLPGSPFTELGNTYVIEVDDATIQAVLVNANSALWRFGVWSGGFLVCVRTSGAGPTGQQNEVVLFDPECRYYYLLNFVAQDATTAAALARLNVTWSVKIAPDGYLYMRSMSGTDDARAFISAFPALSIQSPPVLAYDLPCYIPCDPIYPEPAQ